MKNWGAPGGLEDKNKEIIWHLVTVCAVKFKIIYSEWIWVGCQTTYSDKCTCLQITQCSENMVHFVRSVTEKPTRNNCSETFFRLFIQQEQISLCPGCISCSKWFNDFKFNKQGLLKYLTHSLGFLEFTCCSNLVH